MSGTPRRAWTPAGVVLLMMAAGCAADPGDRVLDGSTGRDAAADEAVADTVDRPTDLAPEVSGPGPDGGLFEPPLTVRACAGASDPSCCPSALDFEDGTTQHFLPASCCRLALSAPQVAAMPTACGHGALRLTADFWATDATSMCGTPSENPACTHITGEITRGVLAPLSLAGRTASVMIYLKGPALPPGAATGWLFVVGPSGTVEGPAMPLARTDTWTALELALPTDADGPGADVQVLGIRITFGGQAWAGQIFVDELTWR